MLLILLIFNNIITYPSADTIIISDWFYLGPFSIGAHEGIIGIDLDLETEDFSPDTTIYYPSILSEKGYVKWRRIQTQGAHITIKYNDVLWNTIQDYYGVAGVLCATIVYGEFECDKRLRALISAKNVGSFMLNGKHFPGDIYGDGFPIPVIINKGKNKVILRLSGYGEHSFSFSILPCSAPMMIIKQDILLPDFIKGEFYNGYIGVPILNTTEYVLKNLKIEVSGEEIEKTEKEIPRIMPFSTIKIPLALKSRDILQKDSVMIRLLIHDDSLAIGESALIMVKKPDEPYKKTFISKIDNSCQYYAVLPPKNYCSESTYALILSCHGAGVEAINQVKSYSQKDWAYVVAPTNRRRFGFDWQDWGRLDFLEVLDEVKNNFNVDIERVYLTGHSMGGHGAWHIGLSHPDLFAAIAPSAGWVSFQLYIPWFLQQSELFAEPDQIKFRDMVLREDITPLYLENAFNLPIYILHGGADDNVPPVQARMMCHYLKNLNYDFVYNEVTNQKHWWDIDTTPGVDCVDLKEMMDFLRDKKKNPYPREIIFKTSDIAHSNKAYWIKIDELENIYQDGRIVATIDSTDYFSDHPHPFHLKFNITTENISAFTILITQLKHVPDYFLFNINGIAYKFQYHKQNEITFAKSKNGFKIIQYRKRGLKKTKDLYGPIKQAYFQPFILVYGTIGDSIDTDNNLHQAWLHAYTWWIRANGYTEILPDTEITEKEIQNYNLILFGNHETNAVIKKINKKLPIHLDKDKIILGKQIIKKSNLCLIEIYPNPLNLEKFIVLYSATTKKANKYLNLFSPLYSGSGLPDFIIWDDTAAKYGWAGVIATGFFNKNWHLDKNMLYLG
ncbi:MAG: prolyl oligopeptidase family serine peptidase, partial [bacterium]